MNAPPSTTTTTTTTGSVLANLGWIDKLLPVWIIICMVVGVVLGYYVPSVSRVLGSTQLASVSLPIAIGLLIMMYPVFCKVRYETLGSVFRARGVLRNLASSLIVNWILAPLLMAALAWACLPDLPGYRTGVLLVGVARCIAMVLIWNDLADGDREWCAIIVAINSVLSLFLYGPFAYFLAVIVGRGEAIDINMWLVIRSVLIFLGIPLVAGLLTRLLLRPLMGANRYDNNFLKVVGPLSLLGLLFTILVMFALQGHRIVDSIGSVFRVAVPLLLYFSIIFTLVFGYCAYTRVAYPVAVTQSLTAASNNFELAIAVAVATYGIDSQEALATVIGPLIEVPVLVTLVYGCLLGRRAYERRVEGRKGDVEEMEVREDGKGERDL